MNKEHIMQTVEAAKLKVKEVEAEFDTLVQMGRTSYVTVKEMGENLFKYQTACSELWEARFREMADTGVKIIV